MNSWGRLRGAIAVALLLGAAAACASDKPQPGPDTTPVVTSRPATTLSTPVLHTPAPPAPDRLRSGGTGSCFNASTVITTAGAYRCFAGNQILDPCFGAAGRTSVVCYADPWTDPVAVRLSRKLTRVEPAPTGGRPWALELVGGIKCVAATGVADIVGTLALSYACRDGGEAGLTDESADARTALYRPDNRSRLRKIAITDVWGG